MSPSVRLGGMKFYAWLVSYEMGYDIEDVDCNIVIKSDPPHIVQCVTDVCSTFLKIHDQN